MTEQTFKEYVKKENLFDDCVKASEFVDMLKHTKKQVSFKDPYLRTPLTQKASGFITLPVMFDLNVFKSCDYDATPVDDFKQLINDYGSWIINSIDGDNSYNHNAPVESYVNINDIQLTSPNDEKSVSIALFSCGVSLDATGGYTKNMAVVFASEDDLIQFMLNSYAVADGDFMFDGKKYYYSLSAEAFSDNYCIYVVDQTTPPEGGYNWENTFDEVWTDSTDKTQLKSDLADLMNDYLDTNKDVTNLTIKYYCMADF